MPKGGARARSGPAPDPDALRRDSESDWVMLPAEGREGPLPEWPLQNQTDRERVFWEREWVRPQAVMWERNRQETEVAMYVRTLADAEQLNATVASRTLTRQLQEALGISLPGLYRNRWRIGDAPTSGATRNAPVPSTRGRFKVMQGGAA